MTGTGRWIGHIIFIGINSPHFSLHLDRAVTIEHFQTQPLQTQTALHPQQPLCDRFTQQTTSRRIQNLSGKIICRCIFDIQYNRRVHCSRIRQTQTQFDRWNSLHRQDSCQPYHHCQQQTTGHFSREIFHRVQPPLPDLHTQFEHPVPGKFHPNGFGRNRP